MIIFDQLRISDDGLRLYVNAHVNAASYFDNIYIKDITIMTADKVSETAPEGIIVSSDSETPVDCIYYKTFEDSEKEINLVIDNAVLNAAYVGTSTDGSTASISYDKTGFSEDLFFIYIRVQGTPDECTPCGLDKEVTVGVTFDENVLHQKVMDFSNEIANICMVPRHFIDFILLWNAFKASVNTDHYISARNYYNMLFGKDADNNDYGPYGSASGVTINTCTCNG